jgi:hypothetical protein
MTNRTQQVQIGNAQDSSSFWNASLSLFQLSYI